MKSFLESLVSDGTRRSYKRGLAKFEEYYGKSSKFLLKEKDPGKTIEKLMCGYERSTLKIAVGLLLIQ